jgi:hypothetical protein
MRPQAHPKGGAGGIRIVSESERPENGIRNRAGLGTTDFIFAVV